MKWTYVYWPPSEGFSEPGVTTWPPAPYTPAQLKVLDELDAQFRAEALERMEDHAD